MRTWKNALGYAAATCMSAAAFGQTWVSHHQRTNDPLKHAEARAIDPTVNNTLLYVASFRDLPQLMQPSQRPLMVELDNDLKPFQFATYARPGETIEPYQTDLFINPHDLFPIREGGSIVCGDFVERGPNGQVLLDGAFLLELDAALNVNWFRVYPQIDVFDDVVELPDNGAQTTYIACGWRVPDNGVPQVAVVAGADLVGGLLWQHDVWSMKNNFRGNAEYREVILTGQQTVALVGSANIRNLPGAGFLADSDVMVTRVDAFGNILFNGVWGNTIQQFPDGVFGIAEKGASLTRMGQSNDLIITGQVEATCLDLCDPGTTLYEDVLALRLTPNGALAWSNRYDIQGDFDFGRSVKAPDGRIGIAADARTDFFNADRSLDVAYMLLNQAGGPIAPADIFGGERADNAAQLYVGSMTSHAVLLASTLSFSPAGYVIPYLIERFAQICHPCHSARQQFGPRAHPMEQFEWFSQEVATGSTFMPLERIDPVLRDEILCKKCLIGDMNGDGVISVADIGPFVTALTNPAQYMMLFPDGCLESADVNCDGIVSVGDIGPFVALVTAP
ncbi:MAG: hypothetical protein AB7N71_11485 [Phycisphaerae bacterium]